MIEAQQPDQSSAGQVFSAPRPLPAIVRFVIAALWTAAVFWFSGFVFSLFPDRNLIPGLLFRLIACLLTGAGFVFCLRVLDYNFAPILPALGLPCDRTAIRQSFVGLALGALLIAVDVAVIACFGSIQFHHHHHMLLRFAAVAALLFFAALLEELSFRGYPFQKLTESLGGFWAVIALSALFGFVHLRNPDAQGVLSWGFFNTIAVGILFALARIRTGSLWFSFGLHFGWNLFQGAVFGLPVSGIREFSTIITAVTHGSPALTGATYGPEASATCSIVLVLAFPLLWIATSPRRFQHRPSSISSSASI